MYKQKTKETDESVIQFIESIENEKKKKDAYRLLEIFIETSGFEGKMWGPSIIGFGKYHYKYASGHEGEAPLVGFSPRKANFALYLAANAPNREGLLANFGKHKQGKSCVYINKLEDINIEVLKALITHSIEYFREIYPNN